MEKTKLYVYRGVEAEEPIASSGCMLSRSDCELTRADMCSFKDLQVKIALMDEIVVGKTQVDRSMLQTIEAKSLRESRRKATGFDQINKCRDCQGEWRARSLSVCGAKPPSTIYGVL